jgi:hypothetical protein
LLHSRTRDTGVWTYTASGQITGTGSLTFNASLVGGEAEVSIANDSVSAYFNGWIISPKFDVGTAALDEDGNIHVRILGETLTINVFAPVTEYCAVTWTGVKQGEWAGVETVHEELLEVGQSLTISRNQSWNETPGGGSAYNTRYFTHWSVAGNVTLGNSTKNATTVTALTLGSAVITPNYYQGNVYVPIEYKRVTGTNTSGDYYYPNWESPASYYSLGSEITIGPTANSYREGYHGQYTKSFNRWQGLSSGVQIISGNVNTRTIVVRVVVPVSASINPVYE